MSAKRERCERCGHLRAATDFREIAESWRVCRDCYDADDFREEDALPERCTSCGAPTSAAGVCEDCYTDEERARIPADEARREADADGARR